MGHIPKAQTELTERWRENERNRRTKINRAKEQNLRAVGARMGGKESSWKRNLDNDQADAIQDIL